MPLRKEPLCACDDVAKNSWMLEQLPQVPEGFPPGMLGVQVIEELAGTNSRLTYNCIRMKQLPARYMVDRKLAYIRQNFRLVYVLLRSRSNLHPFARSTLFNPLHVSKCAQFLSNVSVLQSVFQPYHVHIPYILQFLVGYKLFGMGWLGCCKGTCRRTPFHTTPMRDIFPRFWL